MTTKWDGRPQFSEFSYGFALTHELVGWTAIGAAPVFPSLLAEGRTGGGWDVKLDKPGLPLYLQFKRSQCIASGNGRERRAVRKHIGQRNFNEDLALPYYRFFFMESSLSKQHDLLLELDQGSRDVFYAAPYFHEQSEFDTAWGNRDVTRQTAFVRPRDVGQLTEGKHSIAFDTKHTDRAWVCSEAKSIPVVRADTLLSSFTEKLGRQSTTVREDALKWEQELRNCFDTGVRRHERRVQDFLRREELKAEKTQLGRFRSSSGGPDEIGYALAASPPFAERTVPSPRLVPPLEIERATLGERSDVIGASETASRLFGLQLFVVQKRD